MAVAVPTLEQVIDAIHAVMVAINPSIGAVLDGEHTLEDDVEFLEVGNYIAGGSLDVWFIDVADPPTSPFSGKGKGERYDRYNIRIRYWSMRTANANWSEEARTKAMSVVDVLEGNDAIFKIGGQSQLFTDTTAEIVSHGPLQIRDAARSAGQMIFQTTIALTVEARRWV